MYAVRRHDGSLCNQKQPETEAADNMTALMSLLIVYVKFDTQTLG